MNDVWTEEFAAIPDVQCWNRNVLPWMHERGDEYKRFAHAEAKRRGYMYAPGAKEYVHPFPMRACKGVNLIGVGWQGGKLRCVFASKEGPRHYESEGEVPADVANKLANSPFPDKLFSQIVKGKHKLVRI